MTLAEVIATSAAAADALHVEDAEMAPVVGTTESDGAMVWSVGGTDFATLDAAGTTATFRLDAVLAGAARRTPDVAGSDQGPEWVAFRPTALDGHAVDRVEAWFAAAFRRAV